MRTVVDGSKEYLGPADRAIIADPAYDVQAVKRAGGR